MTEYRVLTTVSERGQPFQKQQTAWLGLPDATPCTGLWRMAIIIAAPQKEKWRRLALAGAGAEASRQSPFGHGKLGRYRGS